MTDYASEIKSRLNIEDVISDYIPLRKAGSSLVGRCPFHSEKTPSFHVSPDRQTFHCFGCGKGGDVFTFLMEIEGLSFKEALELLAARSGVKLSQLAGVPGGLASRRGARSILEDAASFFGSSLTGARGEPARAYLARRNLPDEAWTRFGLGWGPQSWDALLRHLLSSGYGNDEIIESGLAVQGKLGAYDRFRGRVVFTVRDEMGRIAGFGGRLIEGDGIKYVNSPDSDIFNKRKMLYLMHIAKKMIRERKRVILTEGYMDAIRAHLSGYTETVASLGTSLTEEQASLIKRFSDLCYIVYDSDGAGREASIRGMYILQRHGVDVMIVSLPDGKDPDDMLSDEDGAKIFEGLVRKALPLPLYHACVRRSDLRAPERQRAAREDVLSGLASLPLLDVQPFIPKIAEEFGLLQHQLEREIELRRRETGKNLKSAIYAEGIDNSSSVYINEGENSDPAKMARTIDLECALCSLLWMDEEARSKLSSADIVPFLSDEAVTSIVTALLGGDSAEDLELRWKVIEERACPARLARGDAVLAKGLGPEHVNKLAEAIRENALKRRYEQLKLKILGGAGTKEEIAEYDELAKKLKAGA
jgi:DNA primase